MSYLTNLFLNIEAHARHHFERAPFAHAFLAGVGVILFWRGVWEVADILYLGPWSSIIAGVLLLGGIGLFVQTFVGNAIIIKNVEREKQVEQKTERDVTLVEREVKKEEVTLLELKKKLETIESKLNFLSRKS